MSKHKAMIVIELPEVPESCCECSQMNEIGYCYHTGKYVGCSTAEKERHPLCPVIPMNFGIDVVAELLSVKAKNCRNNAKHFGKKAEWMAEAYEDAVEILEDFAKELGR